MMSDRPKRSALVPAVADAAPVHELVRDRAFRRPEAAATDGLTYGELDAWAERIAHSLHDLGGVAGSPVAVRLPVGEQQVAALLGIWKAGCHSVPLGLTDPVQRCAEILAEIRPACLLVEQAHAEDELSAWYRAEFGGPVLAAPARGDAAPGSAALPEAADPDSLAYVVYTSGSTGRPKGIVQSHRGLAQFVAWMGWEFAMGAGRRTALWASPNYDASFCEIFATLVAGGTLCPIPQEIRLDASRLVEWLAQRQVNLLQTVPSFGRELLRAIESRVTADLPELDHLLLAGEPLAGDLAAGFATALAGIRLVNLYGATETILATWLEVTGDWTGTVPVGRAIPGRSVLVLDADDGLCPVGVIGEIVVRSPFLTLGYVGEARRSGPAFTTLTLPGDDAASAGIPCYRTGDQGRWRPDGLLEFRGRRDRQVKLRGIRVELAEIEAALARHESVLDCVVVPADDGGPTNALVAYVVPVAESGSPAIWRAHLRRSLSPQMLPSVFVTLPALPRNAGSKVDRSRLPSPNLARTAADRPNGPRRVGGFRSWSARLGRNTDHS
jgi:amino acid adenylation domain-containing protein